MATDKPFRKGRTLVLLFDGTANEFDDTNTNVVKLAGLLKKKDVSQQMVYYQTGVGTGESNTVLGSLASTAKKVIDLGIALYLDEHVMAGYRFVQDNYHDGDRICIFGFSRGSYTARALAGMLATIGLLPPHMPEQVPFAYSIFKKDTPETRLSSAAYKRTFCRNVTIEFLGVWDTVSSVGALYPRILPFSSGNHMTRVFRHAIALDEHRARFRSNTWHRSVDPLGPSLEAEISVGIWRTLFHTLVSIITTLINFFSFGYFFARKWDAGLTESFSRRNQKSQNEAARWNLIAPRAKSVNVGETKNPPTDVKEVWFAGAHCDVGGGNTMDGDPYALSNIALRWMIKEALEAKCGILFRKPELEKIGVYLAKIKKDKTSFFGSDSDGSQMPSSPKVIDTPLTNGSTNGVDGDLIAKQLAMDDASKLNGNSKPNGVVSDTLKDKKKKKSTKLSRKSTLEEYEEQKRMTPEQRYPDDDYYTVRLTDYFHDMIQPIRDPLFTWIQPLSLLPFFKFPDPFWWLLEVLPAIDAVQGKDYHWRNKVRFNLFRPRNIPMPVHRHVPYDQSRHDPRYAQISTAPALFHVSVRDRMNAREAATWSWKTLWTRKEMYRPMAWPTTGDPVYVE